MTAFLYGDRVKENTSTTGTSDFDLTGAVTNFQTFEDGVGDGAKVLYIAVNDTNNQWERGLGTLQVATGGTTLVRDTVLDNSNGDTSKISFSTAPTIFIDAGAFSFKGQYASAGLDASVTLSNGVFTLLDDWISDEESGDGFFTISGDRITFNFDGLILVNLAVRISANSGGDNRALLLELKDSGGTDQQERLENSPPLAGGVNVISTTMLGYAVDTDYVQASVFQNAGVSMVAETSIETRLQVAWLGSIV